MLSVLLGSSLVAPVVIQAQTDNFDSGTLSSAWTKSQFFSQSYTFPDSATGKALRIQANPAPGAAPAAAAISQTNIYTDFYVALDLANWAEKDQAVVLLGHWTPGGAAGLAGGTGVILNYDVAQDGDTPGDRRGGELQINTIAPGFAAATKAAAEITFEPGHSYRLILQCVGDDYTGMAYDVNDLTKPLVTIRANSATYPVGQCGFLSFSRDGTAGTTDVTIDNYYAGVSYSNPAPAPVMAPSVAGTPIVVTRTPTNRFTNFHPPSSGISFSVQTFSADIINSAATKLYLNGADVSASLLPLPANGTTASFSTVAGTLKTNAVYSARIEVQDVTGTKKSTNTFWFDTFSDAYLLGGVARTIEAEEYNYANGLHQTDPVAVSGFTLSPVVQVNGNGVGYLDLKGEEGVDFHDNRTSGESPWTTEFRLYDPVGLSQGMFGELLDVNDITGTNRFSDNVRSQYAASNLLEFVVHRTEPGEWLNYTRTIPLNAYFAFLRVGSFGSTTVNLEKVTSDPTLPAQTTSALGTFSIPNSLARYNYTYVPALSGNSGSIMTLSGENTLRLAVAGLPSKDNRLISMNYLLLVPAQVKLLSSSTVDGTFAVESGATVSLSTRTITIPVSGSARFYRLDAVVPMTITGVSVSGGTVTMTF